MTLHQPVLAAEVKGVKRPFSDVDEAQRGLAARSERA